MEHLYNIITIFLVIAGWVIAHYLNRKQEINKNRVELRLDMLKSVMRLDKILPEYIINGKKSSNTTDEFAKAMSEVDSKVAVFGNAQELKFFGRIKEHAQESQCFDDKLAKLLLEFIEMVKKNMRKEFSMF